MSLADELLADLEEGGEEVEQSDEDMEAEVADIDEASLTTAKSANTVRNVAKLLDSKEVSLTFQLFRTMGISFQFFLLTYHKEYRGHLV